MTGARLCFICLYVVLRDMPPATSGENYFRAGGLCAIMAELPGTGEPPEGLSCNGKAM
jgi:hypothetical protein